MFLLSVLLAAAPASPGDARRAAERELFRKVVELQTVEGRLDQFRALTALLTAELRAAGLTTVVKDHDGTQTLIARWTAPRPSGKKPILLMAHMDVVEARAEDWKHPPFKFREEAGHYLGRGTSDNKAALIGIVLALQQLRRQGFTPTRDLVVLFTGDEETTGNGARRAATEWRSLIDAEYALNGDAGGGAVYPDGRVQAFYMQLAEKVYADFTFAAVNRGGHSSAPRPDNAIYALASALTALERHRFRPMINDATRSSFEEQARLDPGQYGELLRRYLADPADRETADLLEAVEPGSTRTRCVATMLSGGHAVNALAQSAQANVNCRIFPGHRVDDVRAELERLAGPDVTVTPVARTAMPATEATPMRKDVLDAFKAAVSVRFKDAPVVGYQSAGATDGAFLRAAGIPVYGFGGLWGLIGEKDGVHGLDERVLVEGFHGQVPIWVEMIRRVAG